MKFQVEYRKNGQWLMLGSRHKTKKAAQEFAKKSSLCQREGYQISKYRK